MWNMNGLDNLGRIMLIIGGGIFLLGLLLTLLGKVPFLGRLPGDILIRRGSFTLYMPILTSILLSLLLTVVLNIIRLFHR